MSTSAIKTENIYKRYGKKEVLKGVSLDVHKGDIYGLVGKNGAGKTTLFKTILGLSDYTSGTLTMNESTKLNDERQKMGFMVGVNMYGYMDAKGNLDYYARLKGIKNRKEEIDRVLKLVELEGVKTKVSGFSLGMKQRLGIAAAILGNPEILILDEPTNGLDPKGIQDIRNLIKRLNQEYGMTVIVSSHILGELQNTATRFGILNNGVMVKELTQEDLMKSQNVVRIKVEDTELARKILEENNVNVLEMKNETKSLEDYYFELVGGQE